MTKKILAVFLLAISLFSSLPALAFDAGNIKTRLQGTCDVPDDVVSKYESRIRNNNKDDNSYIAEEYARELVSLCVEEELNRKILEENTEEDNHKLTKFLEGIAPLQEEYPTTTQFNSVGWGITFASLVGQLNRLIRPDNWLILPDFTGSPISEQLAKEGGITTPDFLNLQDMTNIVSQAVLGLVAVLISIILFRSLFVKNRVKFILSQGSTFLTNACILAFLPILMAGAIWTTNVANNLVSNINNNIQLCDASDGYVCTTQRSFQFMQKMDFHKLPADKVHTKTELDWFKINDFDWGSIVWGLYYLFLFGAVGIGSLFFSGMFATAQILTWLKLIGVYVASYFGMLLPDHDLTLMGQKIFSLLWQSVANTITYVIFSTLVLLILKDGMDFMTIFVVLMIWLHFNMISQFILSVLGLKKIPEVSSFGSFGYIDLARSVKHQSKHWRTSIDNLADKTGRYRKSALEFGQSARKFAGKRLGGVGRIFKRK